MNSDKFRQLCIEAIVGYFNTHTDKSSNEIVLTADDVFEVWACKTLQNNKGLFSTTMPDGMYYEMTYNGDKDELYMDAYKKWENVCICCVTGGDDANVSAGHPEKN